MTVSFSSARQRREGGALFSRGELDQYRLSNLADQQPITLAEASQRENWVNYSDTAIKVGLGVLGTAAAIVALPAEIAAASTLAVVAAAAPVASAVWDLAYDALQASASDAKLSAVFKQFEQELESHADATNFDQRIASLQAIAASADLTAEQRQRVDAVITVTGQGLTHKAVQENKMQVGDLKNSIQNVAEMTGVTLANTEQLMEIAGLIQGDVTGLRDTLGTIGFDIETGFQDVLDGLDNLGDAVAEQGDKILANQDKILGYFEAQKEAQEKAKTAQDKADIKAQQIATIQVVSLLAANSFRLLGVFADALGEPELAYHLTNTIPAGIKLGESIALAAAAGFAAGPVGAIVGALAGFMGALFGGGGSNGIGTALKQISDQINQLSRSLHAMHQDMFKIANALSEQIGNVQQQIEFVSRQINGVSTQINQLSILTNLRTVKLLQGQASIINIMLTSFANLAQSVSHVDLLVRYHIDYMTPFREELYQWLKEISAQDFNQAAFWVDNHQQLFALTSEDYKDYLLQILPWGTAKALQPLYNGGATALTLNEISLQLGRGFKEQIGINLGLLVKYANSLGIDTGNSKPANLYMLLDSISKYQSLFLRTPTAVLQAAYQKSNGDTDWAIGINNAFSKLLTVANDNQSLLKKLAGTPAFLERLFAAYESALNTVVATIQEANYQFFNQRIQSVHGGEFTGFREELKNFDFQLIQFAETQPHAFPTMYGMIWGIHYQDTQVFGESTKIGRPVYKKIEENPINKAMAEETCLPKYYGSTWSKPRVVCGTGTAFPPQRNLQSSIYTPYTYLQKGYYCDASSNVAMYPHIFVEPWILGYALTGEQDPQGYGQASFIRERIQFKAVDAVSADKHFYNLYTPPIPHLSYILGDGLKNDPIQQCTTKTAPHRIHEFNREFTDKHDFPPIPKDMVDEIVEMATLTRQRVEENRIAYNDLSGVDIYHYDFTEHTNLRPISAIARNEISIEEWEKIDSDLNGRARHRLNDIDLPLVGGLFEITHMTKKFIPSSFVWAEVLGLGRIRFTYNTHENPLRLTIHFDVNVPYQNYFGLSDSQKSVRISNIYLADLHLDSIVRTGKACHFAPSIPTVLETAFPPIICQWYLQATKKPLVVKLFKPDGISDAAVHFIGHKFDYDMVDSVQKEALTKKAGDAVTRMRRQLAKSFKNTLLQRAYDPVDFLHAQLKHLDLQAKLLYTYTQLLFGYDAFTRSDMSKPPLWTAATSVSDVILSNLPSINALLSEIHEDELLHSPQEELLQRHAEAYQAYKAFVLEHSRDEAEHKARDLPVGYPPLDYALNVMQSIRDQFNLKQANEQFAKEALPDVNLQVMVKNSLMDYNVTASPYAAMVLHREFGKDVKASVQLADILEDKALSDSFKATPMGPILEHVIDAKVRWKNGGLSITNIKFTEKVTKAMACQMQLDLVNAGYDYAQSAKVLNAFSVPKSCTLLKKVKKNPVQTTTDPLRRRREADEHSRIQGVAAAEQRQTITTEFESGVLTGLGMLLAAAAGLAIGQRRNAGGLGRAPVAATVMLGVLSVVSSQNVEPQAQSSDSEQAWTSEGQAVWIDGQPAWYHKNKHYSVSVHAKMAAQASSLTLANSAKGESIKEDIFIPSSCRSVEWHGQPSIVCDGEKTTMLYQPVQLAGHEHVGRYLVAQREWNATAAKIAVHPFSDVTGNLLLGQVAYHAASNVWQVARDTVTNWWQGENKAVMEEPALVATDEAKMRLQACDDLLCHYTADLSKAKADYPNADWKWAAFCLSDYRDDLAGLFRQMTVTEDELATLEESLRGYSDELEELRFDAKHLATSVQPISVATPTQQTWTQAFCSMFSHARVSGEDSVPGIAPEQSNLRGNHSTLFVSHETLFRQVPESVSTGQSLLR